MLMLKIILTVTQFINYIYDKIRSEVTGVWTKLHNREIIFRTLHQILLVRSNQGG